MTIASSDAGAGAGVGAISVAPPAALSRPQAILFDWDNTLVDTWPSIRAALNVTLRAFDLPEWTLAETRARVRHSMRDSFPKLFGAEWQAAADVFFNEFRRIHLAELRPLCGAEALLADLAGEGFYLAVVSNKRGDTLRREADHLGWTKHFSRLVGAQDAAQDKPAVDPVDLALLGSNISRGPNVWFVGDTDIDMQCASGAGCVPLLLRPEAPAAGEFPACQPVWHGIGCEALSKLLRTL